MLFDLSHQVDCHKVIHNISLLLFQGLIDWLTDLKNERGSGEEQKEREKISHRLPTECKAKPTKGLIPGPRDPEIKTWVRCLTDCSTQEPLYPYYYVNVWSVVISPLSFLVLMIFLYSFSQSILLEVYTFYLCKDIEFASLIFFLFLNFILLYYL